MAVVELTAYTQLRGSLASALAPRVVQEQTGSSDMRTKWQEHTEAAWEQLRAQGIVSSRTAWTAHPLKKPPPRLQGLSCTERQLAVINYVFVRYCAKQAVDPASEDSLKVTRCLMVDVSQSIGRQTCGTEHVPAIASSTLVYSYFHDKVISPAELLQVYGFPAPPGEAGSRENLKDLVAECMAMPSLGVVLVAMLSSVGPLFPGVFPSAVQA
jgi:hypothetical protein